MRKNAFRLMSLLSILFLVALCAPAPAAADDDDPPSRVARLSFTRGAVSFQPAGTDDWIDATINRPMTTGDKVWSDQGSRAALHIGSASINLSENTGFSFLNLTDTMTQLQVTSGSIRVRVKRLGDDENFEIDTPNLAFSVLRPGIYKVSVNDAGDSTVAEVRKGEGEVTGSGSAYNVHAGEVGTFSGIDQLNADVEGINNDEDDFDHWSEQRDHHEDNSVSARYVSDDAIGYDDLDDNGGWRPVPQYGNVWFPHTTIAGWAPYHYGHWAYIAPWGYTWVDDAAWGFAPFHYGRWVTVDGAWGWVPCAPRPAVYGGGGAVYVRPVYAPALVAWVGGPHFGVGVALGGGVGVGVGWFPLGPREVFVPSYHVSRAYVNNVNVSNTTVNTTVVNNYYNTVVVNKSVNVTNVTYVNQRVPGAVTATSGQAFSSGQSVSKNTVRVDAREVASAPVNVRTPAAVPQREAVLGGGTSVNVKPPAAVQARVVVAKTAPPPPPPSFTQRQEAIKSNGGEPLSVAQARQITPVRTQAAAAPQVKIAPAAKPSTPQNGQANRGGQPQNSAQPPNNGNRPGVNTPAQVNGNRPNEGQNNASRPGQPATNNAQPQNNTQSQDNAHRPGGNAPSQVNGNRTNEVQNNANRPGQPAANNSQPQNNTQPQNNANRPGGNAPSQLNGNQPAPNKSQPQNTTQQNTADRPGANVPSQVNGNRPNEVQNNANRHEQPPNSQPANNNNRPAVNQPAISNAKPQVDRPPTARPANPQLEQQHQQQNVDLHKQQDQERQRLEQQQQQQQQQLQKQKADEARQQQTQQQHEQQLQEMQKKHAQEQQQLQQKQEQEHQRAQTPPPQKPQPQSKPDQKPKSKDDKSPTKE